MQNYLEFQCEKIEFQLIKLKSQVCQEKAFEGLQLYGWMDGP